MTCAGCAGASRSAPGEIPISRCRPKSSANGFYETNSTAGLLPNEPIGCFLRNEPNLRAGVNPNKSMCRSIKVLRRPGECATVEEMDSAALQFVRKITGFQKPSRANQQAFERAIAEISASSARLLETIAAGAPASRSTQTDALRPWRAPSSTSQTASKSTKYP